MLDVPTFGGLAIRSRSGTDDRFYNPERDLSVIAGRALSAVSAAFNADKWPYIVETLASPEESADNVWNAICDTHDVVIEVLRRSTEADAENNPREFRELLTVCGWDRLTTTGKVGYLSVLGHVMLGFFVGALRSETFEAKEPEVITNALKLARGTRISFMDISQQDDLLQTLQEVVVQLRNAGADWEVIQRVLAREKNLES